MPDELGILKDIEEVLLEGDQTLTGRKKCAILFVALDPNISSQVFKYLKEEDIEKITAEISTLKRVPQEVIDAVFEEFYEMAVEQKFISGGSEDAYKILEGALGQDRASRIMRKIKGTPSPKAFTFLKDIELNQILNIIKDENPQFIAVTLSYLEPKQAAYLIENLPSKIQEEVISKMLTMRTISPEILSDVEDMLKEKINITLTRQDLSGRNKIEQVGEIINNVTGNKKDFLLNVIKNRHRDLSDKVRKLVFTFEDILSLSDRDLQQALIKLDTKDIALLLKGADEIIKNKIYNNISTQAKEYAEEELEYLEIKGNEIENAQQKLINIIQNLAKEGVIVIKIKE